MSRSPQNVQKGQLFSSDPYSSSKTWWAQNVFLLSQQSELSIFVGKVHVFRAAHVPSAASGSNCRIFFSKGPLVRGPSAWAEVIWAFDAVIAPNN